MLRAMVFNWFSNTPLNKEGKEPLPHEGGAVLSVAHAGAAPGGATTAPPSRAPTEQIVFAIQRSYN